MCYDRQAGRLVQEFISDQCGTAAVYRVTNTITEMMQIKS